MVYSDQRNIEWVDIVLAAPVRRHAPIPGREYAIADIPSGVKHYLLKFWKNLVEYSTW